MGDALKEVKSGGGQTAKGKHYVISFLCGNPKRQNEQTKTEIDSQVQRTNLRLPEEGGSAGMTKIGEGDWGVQTSGYKTKKS